MPWPVVRSLPQFGSASNILSCLLSVSWSISSVSFSVKVLAGPTPRISSCLISCFPNLRQWGHLHSPPQAAYPQPLGDIITPRSALSSLNPRSFASGFTSSFVTSHCLMAGSSLLATILFWSSIFVKCHTAPSLVTRRQHSHRVSCLWVSWVTDTQWPLTNRLRERWAYYF